MEATLRGSILILSIWLLRSFLRRWFGARATHLLWLVVLVQLLSPWLPQSPLSLLPERTEHPPVTSAAVQSVQVSVRVGEAPVQMAPERPVVTDSPSPWPAYALFIWGLGGGCIAALSILRAVRAARLVSRAPEIGDRALLRAALADLPQVPRRLRICETGELRSPALCGILRPTVLLPAGWAEQFSAEELRCVLLHEIGHLRRGDLIWHWAFLLARAVHWFNPLVWLAERSARADQEMACDEWVLARSVSFNEQVYGEVLLKASRMLGAPRIVSPLHATMAESKIGLTRRIRHLAQVRSHGWRAVMAALVLAVGLLIVVAPSRSRAQADVSSQNVAAPPSQEQPDSGVVEKRVDPTPASATWTHVEIEAKFVELSGDTGQPKELSEGGKKILGAQEYVQLINTLNQRNGTNLVSMPPVTTPSGRRAVIEILREVRYPTKFAQAKDGSGKVAPIEFESRKAGITLEVTPEILPDGRIELLLAPEIVEFEGFVNYRASRPARAGKADDALSELLEPASADHVLNQPIFNTRKLTTCIVLKPGHTALVGGIRHAEEQNPGEQAQRSFMDAILGRGISNPPAAALRHGRSLYIFVTAHLVDSHGVPADRTRVVPVSPGPIPLPANNAGALPLPKKPGFITSPYAPNVGYIDVRGFPSGAEIKCPYTGKMFRLP